MYPPTPRPKLRIAAFPVNPNSIAFAPLPPQELPINANNPVANNGNPLPLSPSAQFTSSTNTFVPQLFHPPPPQKNYQPQYFVPYNSVNTVGTSVNLDTVQPAPLCNPYFPRLLRSSFHEQATSGSQNYVTSDFMQASPFSSSTGIAPNFVTLIIPQTYGAIVPNPL